MLDASSAMMTSLMDIPSRAEEAATADPRGTGIVRHEFAAEGDEELTVEVDDRVDVFEEHDGWLLCRRQDTGAMGLVPATYVEEQRGGVAEASPTKHRREPTLGGDEEVTEPLVPTGPEPPQGKHRREPTFEFEEAAGVLAVGCVCAMARRVSST